MDEHRDYGVVDNQGCALTRVTDQYFDLCGQPWHYTFNQLTGEYRFHELAKAFVTPYRPRRPNLMATSLKYI
jgi:hypothetical protein